MAEEQKLDKKKPKGYFLPPGRRVLLLGNDGVSLFAPTKTGIEHEITLSWDSDDFDRQLTAALIRQYQGLSIQVIFDGADQTYRKEDGVPNLNPMDKIKYLKLKLDQAFPSYPVKAYIEIPGVDEKDLKKKAKTAFNKNKTPEQEVKEEPPKDDKKAKKVKKVKPPSSYLFVALSDTGQVDRVSKILRETAVPIAGFGLLPAESEALITTMAKKLFVTNEKESRWGILITQSETGGLRQVVVKDGKLALTRMTAEAEAGIQGAAWGASAIREFKSTMTYISRFGYTPDQGLDVIVLSSDEDKPIFTEESLGVENLRVLNIHEALNVIGIKGENLETSCLGGALYAAWISRKKFLSLFVRVPSIFNLMIPRWTFTILSNIMAITLSGLLVFTGIKYYEYATLVSTIEQKVKQKNILARELKQEEKTHANLPIKPEVLEGTLAVKETLDLNSIEIQPLLHVFKRSLPKDMKLRNFSYTHLASFAAKKGRKKQVRGRGRGDTKQPAVDRGEVKISFSFYLIGDLPLEVKVTRAEKIVDHLREIFKGYTVVLTSQFGNVSRTGNFSGATDVDEGLTGGLISEGDLRETAAITMTGPPL